jgi:hypothetical protein
MAVKRIHKVPDELPHAHLFLDDIEEISKILLAAHEPVLAHTKREPRISFVIKDSQMDSIEDLKVRGGSTAELRITVGGALARVSKSMVRSTPELLFMGWMTPTGGWYMARSNLYSNVVNSASRTRLRACPAG